jgi:hypothetical protein
MDPKPPCSTRHVLLVFSRCCPFSFQAEDVFKPVIKDGWLQFSPDGETFIVMIRRRGKSNNDAACLLQAFKVMPGRCTRMVFFPPVRVAGTDNVSFCSSQCIAFLYSGRRLLGGLKFKHPHTNHTIRELLQTNDSKWCGGGKEFADRLVFFHAVQLSTTPSHLIFGVLKCSDSACLIDQDQVPSWHHLQIIVTIRGWVRSSINVFLPGKPTSFFPPQRNENVSVLFRSRLLLAR